MISTSDGDVTVELWNDVAPKHVENFLKLARDGFYRRIHDLQLTPQDVDATVGDLAPAAGGDL